MAIQGGLMSKILILGGYGNFGKRIAFALAKDLEIIVAGRNFAKAQNQKAEILAKLPNAKIETIAFDAEIDLAQKIDELKPQIIINTCGPFQEKDYKIAKICIEKNVHYIDLADGRDFVTGISQFDAVAKANNTAIISGASTVPALSSAVVEKYLPQFKTIETMRYGISPGQKAERGLATMRGILGYAGKKLRAAFGQNNPIYGWQDIYLQKFPEIGFRWMANCDIPDLDLFGPKYGIKNIRFGAGLELWSLHLGLWALSWLVRLGLPIKLENHAQIMLKAADWFNYLGSDDGGMFVVLEGIGQNDERLKKSWAIIAKNGDGPHIPTIPAIILARKLAKPPFITGAMPCVGIVNIEEYLEELKDFDISTFDDFNSQP